MIHPSWENDTYWRDRDRSQDYAPEVEIAEPKPDWRRAHCISQAGEIYECSCGLLLSNEQDMLAHQAWAAGERRKGFAALNDSLRGVRRAG